MIPKDILEMQEEKNYDFRKRLDNIHKKNIRNHAIKAETDEYMFSHICFECEKDFGSVVKIAMEDFTDFMIKSMEVDSGTEANVILKLSDDLGEYNSYKGYRIEVGDKVVISGFDERGVAQALYNLEDVLSLRRAPFIKKDVYYRKPMYSPQMVHSGYGFDMYPDSYLQKLVHEGRDAIMIFVRGLNQTPKGFLDFNDVIERAAKFGIDVYAYSNMDSNFGPYQEGAEEFYENSYGRLFDECPGFKGVILCGESVEFESVDPHVSGSRYYDNVVDGIPTGKVSPGWYPCCDYPDWLRLIQKVLYKRNRNVDIIFWSYNWYRVNEEARIALINALPEGITCQATFEMGGIHKMETASYYSADYSLAGAGPCEYFTSEAQAAKKCNLKFYGMTNTAGQTWDFGVIPYVPAPQQWQKRYKEMEKFYDKGQLSGINECHHYGLYPSFISKLSKWSFSEPKIPYDKLLADVIKMEFGDEVDKITQALGYISEGMTYYTPTDADQYGAFRVGPAYPFCLNRLFETTVQFNDKAFPGVEYICHTEYIDHETGLGNTFIGIRIPEEIRSLEKMLELFRKGVELLDSIENKNEELLFLTNQCHFMTNSIITGLNAKKWYLLQCKTKVETDRIKLKMLMNDMETLLLEELENAKETITYVSKDSRLGWEPTMGYVGDVWHLEWKIRQVKAVLESDLKHWKNSVDI